MEISKNYQAPEQILVASNQSGSTQQIGEKNQVADVLQQDFQVNLQDGLKIKLVELANILQNREQLIQSLPDNIRKAVIELLEQMSAATKLPQGLENLLKGQKNASEQLKDMSNILDFSAVLTKDEHSEVRSFLQKTFEIFTKQATKTPEQSAKELVELAKQWTAHNTVAPEKSSQMKVADAWQFKDIQPKTLQAAADLLRQLVQEMEPDTITMTGKLEQLINSLSSEVGNKAIVVTQLEQFIKTLPAEVNNKGTVAAQLEQFIKNLPPEIDKALQQVLKQGNIPDNLRRLADTFSNAAVLNEKMSTEPEAVIVKNSENFVAKSPAISADANNVLTQGTKQFADGNTTVEQLKNMIQQLKSQMFVGDPKILEKQQHVLDQLTKLFEPIIPQVLQGMVKHQVPELPQIWVMLKALGTKQWENIESGNLRKSADVVKELAQSIYKATGLTGEKIAEHSTLAFSIPLHVAEGIYYHAHIHIYHEQKDNSNELAQREFETWLRVGVDTENIGMVDSVFRLYGDNKLDIRVNVPVLSAANQFTQDLPNVRKSLDGIKLSLIDIMINKA